MSGGAKIFSGVLHVHTDHDGGAPFETILEAARDTHADFVVITDRSPTQELRDRKGWHKGILVLVAEEVCCSDGQFMAFETREPLGEATTADAAIEKVRRQGAALVGMNYLLHNGKRRKCFPPPLNLSDVDIVEAWSFLDEFLTRVPGNRVLQFQVRPERVLHGPSRSLLSAWDKELMARPVPIVGGVNAYLRKDPLLDWREIFPFKVSFNTVRTAIIAPELSKQDKLAAKTVWNALREGRSFLINQSLGAPENFAFHYVTASGRSHGIGETVLFEPGAHLETTLPMSTEVILRRNGEPLYWGTAQDFRFPAPAPGVYRLEAYVDRRAWILTNAIRVLRETGPSKGPTTVFDFT